MNDSILTVLLFLSAQELGKTDSARWICHWDVTMHSWSGESRLISHYRRVNSKGCVLFWAIDALWGNREGPVTGRTESQMIVPFMKKALGDPRNKKCEFTCPLCVPKSRLSPLPTWGGSSQMEVDNSPAAAIRKAGLSTAGGSPTHTKYSLAHFHSTGITKCNGNDLLSGWQRKASVTPGSHVALYLESCGA